MKGAKKKREKKEKGEENVMVCGIGTQSSIPLSLNVWLMAELVVSTLPIFLLFLLRYCMASFHRTDSFLSLHLCFY